MRGKGKGTKLGEGGKALSYARGKISKLGEHCPKVRLSQDRLPIEAHFAQVSFAQMSLRANVTQPSFTVIIFLCMLKVVPGILNNQRSLRIKQVQI